MSDELDDKIEKALPCKCGHGDGTHVTGCPALYREAVRTLLTERFEVRARKEGAREAYLRCAKNCASHPHFADVFVEWAEEADRAGKGGA